MSNHCAKPLLSSTGLLVWTALAFFRFSEGNMLVFFCCTDDRIDGRRSDLLLSGPNKEKDLPRVYLKKLLANIILHSGK